MSCFSYCGLRSGSGPICTSTRGDAMFKFFQRPNQARWYGLVNEGKILPLGMKRTWSHNGTEHEVELLAVYGCGHAGHLEPGGICQVCGCAVCRPCTRSCDTCGRCL